MFLLSSTCLYLLVPFINFNWCFVSYLFLFLCYLMNAFLSTFSHTSICCFSMPTSVLFPMIPIPVWFLIILVSLCLVSVVWQDCAYVLTISNHKIFVVKRPFSAEEQGTVSQTTTTTCCPYHQTTTDMVNDNDCQDVKC